MKKLNDLTLPELFALDRNYTLVVLPVAGIDERGSLIPLGFDTIKTEKMSEDFSSQFETDFPKFQILITPTLHASVDSVNTKYPFHFRPHIIRDWVVDQVTSLNRFGFIRFIAITGTVTPKNLTALEDAEKILIGGLRLSFKKTNIKYISLNSAAVSKSLSLIQMLFPDQSEHGKKQDTDFLKKYYPSVFRSDVGNVDSQGVLTNEHPLSPWGRYRRWATGKTSGSWERVETPDPAPVQYETLIRNQVEKVNQWVNGQTNKSTFRSWYSVIPQNKSFAKSWLLTAVIFIIFTLALTIGF